MSALPSLEYPDTPRPRAAWTTSRRCALLGALVLSASDCWYSVEQYCAQCQLVTHAQVSMPAVAPGTHTEVVLIHGAFGFGAGSAAAVRGASSFCGVWCATADSGCVYVGNACQMSLKAHSG